MRPASQPLLSPVERAAVAGASWFVALPATVRHDLLRVLAVRRLAHGEAVFRRGDAATAWLACAAGAVRISGSTANGRPLTWTFVRPGHWFGDPPLAADDVRVHDAHAHGATTVVAVARADLQAVLREQPALYPALMRLQALRMRQAFGLVEDFASLGLRARLLRQLLQLARSHGVPCRGGEVRIALRMRQDLLAEMLGCSRQRVNEQLRDLARADLVRKEAGALVLRDCRDLERQAAGAA